MVGYSKQQNVTIVLKLLEASDVRYTIYIEISWYKIVYRDMI